MPNIHDREVVFCDVTQEYVVAEYEGDYIEYDGWLHLHKNTIEEDRDEVFALQ